MIKGIIFDKDGTLFDSETLHVKFWVEAAMHYGFSDDSSTIKKCIGINHLKGEEILGEVYGDKVPLMREYKEKAFENYVSTKGMPLKAGVLETLDYVKKHYKLAVATSTQRKVAIRNLERTKLLPYFETVISGDEIEFGKPNPDIFLKAAHNLGLKPEECIVVEDSKPGIKGAKTGNFIGVFIPDLIEVNEEIKENSTYIFKNMLEFLEALKENKIKAED